MMASITSWGNVANQAGTQHVAGNIVNNVYLNEPSSTRHDSPAAGGVDDPYIRDEDILKSFAFAQMLDRRSNIDRPHEGTCQWIFKLPEYKDWQSASCGLLWIRGHPGSGKSTLMSYLFDLLANEKHKEKHIILNFFCNARGTELQHSAFGLFRSLLNQLYSQVESSRPMIRETYTLKHRAHGYDSNLWSWQEIEARDLFTSAMLSMDSKIQVTVFIDALDELGETVSRDMARHFHMVNDKVNAFSQKLKFCISSRHYPIASAIPGIAITMEQNNREDIGIFVRESLRTIVLDDNNENNKELQTLTRGLLGQARGIFQWVRLIIPMVEKMLLDGESLNEILKWMKHLPTELSEVYEHIIRNVINPKSLQQSCMLFQWVLLAPRALTVRELRYALACSTSIEPPRVSFIDPALGFVDSDNRMVQRLRALSGGLLQVIPSTEDAGGTRGSHENTVQVVHQSVSDYFIESGLRLLISMQVDSKILTASFDIGKSEELSRYCHLNLYRCCLNYLTQFKDDEGMLFKEMLRSPGEIFLRRPLLRHATISLFIHASKVGGFPRDEIVKEAKRLQQVFNVWRLIHRCNLTRSPPPRVPGAATLLHVAAGSDLADVAGYLIASNYNVHAKASGLTPMHFAAQAGSIKTARLLHQAGADLQNTAQTAQMPVLTPLRYAVLGGHHDFAQWLLEEDVQATERSCEPFSILLVDAIRSGDTEMVQLLLQQGANLSYEPEIDTLHCTLVELAVLSDHVSIAHILEAAGAPIDTPATPGRCLQAAVFTKNVTLIRCLIARHKSPPQPIHGLDLSLHKAAQLGCLDIFEVLLEAGADIEYNWKGRSILDGAISSCNTELVVRVLQIGTGFAISSFVFRVSTFPMEAYVRWPVADFLIYDHETNLSRLTYLYNANNFSLAERDRINTIVRVVRDACDDSSGRAVSEHFKIYVYESQPEKQEKRRIISMLRHYYSSASDHDIPHAWFIKMA